MTGDLPLDRTGLRGGQLRGGGSTARLVKDPAATFTASGNHHGLVCPAGGTWNDEARSTDQALRALTTREAYALVAPHYGNSDTAYSTSDPLGTVTTRDRHALIMRNNEGGAEVSTLVREVIRTLTSRGHQSLVTPGELDAARAQVDDCEFRMFEPHEVAAGMAFPLDYQWLGSRRDRVKLAGNAVCPPAARDLVGAVVEALTSPATPEGAAALRLWSVCWGSCWPLWPSAAAWSRPLPAPAAPGPVGAQVEALTVVPRPRDDGTYRRAAFGRVDANGCRQRVICKFRSGYWT